MKLMMPPISFSGFHQDRSAGGNQVELGHDEHPVHCQDQTTSGGAEGGRKPGTR